MRTRPAARGPGRSWSESSGWGLARPSSGPSQPGLWFVRQSCADRDDRAPNRAPNRMDLGLICSEPSPLDRLGDLALTPVLRQLECQSVGQHLLSPPLIPSVDPGPVVVGGSADSLAHV